MRTFFININRSGGSMVERTLGLTHQHGTAKEFIEHFGRDEWDAGFKFTFVRNPWDRAFALFHFRSIKDRETQRAKPLVFAEWLQRVFVENDPDYYTNPKMFMPQTEWLLDDAGKISLNQIARFENKEADFAKICQVLGIEVELPERSSPRLPDYREFYDPDTTELISQWFASDIDRFGYSFE